MNLESPVIKKNGLPDDQIAFGMFDGSQGKLKEAQKNMETGRSPVKRAKPSLTQSREFPSKGN